MTLYELVLLSCISGTRDDTRAVITQDLSI